MSILGTTRKAVNVGFVTMALMMFPILASADAITVLTGNSTAFTVSNSDLIEQGQPSFGSLVIVSGSLEFGSSVSNVNDGLVYGGGPAIPGNTGNTAYTLSPSDGFVLDIDLNTLPQPGGYTIDSIVTLTGTNQERASQVYDLSYATAADPTTFIPVASVDAVTSEGSGEEQVTITGDDGAPIGTGIAVLQFTFHNDPIVGTDMYQEIDVFGPEGSVATPEPATLMLLAPGLFGLARLRFRSRKNGR
jgi:hypothetical protein